ncbi:FG-GAP-like repeat-containing protein [Streptosporangium sp. NPDC006013]|uniref:FG-GAP-like repeat-containing protein n=1 Tax=Streptosporangium sp. NPDC006013 TaxID=3155596 RepID=UPI0033B71157
MALFSRHLLVSMLSIVVATAMVGIAPATPARAADQDFILTLNASDLGLDPADLRDIVPEMQADIREHGGLGPAIKQTLADNQDGATVDTSEWPNFDGTVNVTSNGAGLVVTIPAGEVTTSWSWKTIAAGLIAWTTGYGLRTMCIAALTATGVGAATIPLVCTPLQGAVTGIMGPLMMNAFNGTLGTPKATSEIIIGGLLGLAGGFLWEKYLAPWAKANLANAMRSVGTWVRSRVPWLDSWFGSGVANRADELGHQLEELEDLLNEAMRDWGGLRPSRPSSLRVMPLGDSITYGVESSDGNGYRDELYAYLENSWSSVDFVGSVKGGSMSDPDNQGHPGKRIGEIAAFAYCTVPRYQPNVITLHAGTNDMNQDYHLSEAPTRLKKLINQALTHSPRATMLVAKLIPTGKAGLQPRIDAYNAALPGMVQDLQSEGKHVLLVDMKRVPVSDGLQNDAHPTDAGYAKMADAWYSAISAADAKGWIQTPLPENAANGCNPADSPVDDGPTGSNVGSGDPGGSTVGSSGTALGTGWRALGVIAPGYGTRIGRTIIAELNGDQRADYLQVAADGSFRASVNTVGTPGQPDWVNVGTYAPATSDVSKPIDVNGDEVRFADLNGDGRDDYLLVSSDSKVRAYLNFPGPDNKLKFIHWGTVFSEESFSRNNLRFADVTGDGRDDILRVSDAGAVHVYRNMWDPNSAQVSSEPQPPDWRLWLNWAGGTQGSSLEAVRFADGDGDGRADYLQVGGDGSVHAFLNRGGGGNGSFEARHNWAYASNYPRQYVQFADISGDGKADYLVVYDGGAVRAWLNRGGN